METKGAVIKATYCPSSLITVLQARLMENEGIFRAIASMGTESNKQMLTFMSLLAPEVSGAAPDDLMVVLQGEDPAVLDSAVAGLEPMIREIADGYQSM